ncbi:hypothetical protein CPB85DRAFT_1435426 [Mucidula mucida]|nr:hypothetical protein CPB85DRAFT_1435426 [Mucidula mucida]
MATNASVGYVHDLSGDLRLDRRLVVNVSVLSEGYRLQALHLQYVLQIIFTALTLVASASAAALAPATITACSGSLNPANGCVTIPVVSDTCTNFTGGLSFLNKEVSNVQVPGGFVCSFYEDFGCLNSGVNGHDVAVLTGGSWTMSRVQGIAGTQDFNDKTSSFSCSPV